jgi:hypothetical protein
MALGDNLTTSNTVPNLVVNIDQPVLSTDGTVTQGVTTAVTQPEVIVAISDTGILTAVSSGQVVATVEGVYHSAPTPTLGFFERVLDALITSTENIFWVEKVLLETTSLTEQIKFVLGFIRSYSDVTTLNNPISLNIGKSYSDIVNAQAGDLLLKTVGKSLQDSIQFNDSYTFFEINRSVLDLDLAQISSEYKFYTEKLLVDKTNLVTDQLSTISSYFRTLQDLIVATDDYYGLANIDDDQYAQFIKRVTDNIQITDSVAATLQYYRDYADQILIQDSHYKSVQKVSVDRTNSVIDQFTRVSNYFKTLQDLASSNDSYYQYMLQKALIDKTNLISDSVASTLLYYRDYTDQVIVRDSHYKSVQKAPVDRTNSIIDQFTRVSNYFRTLEDLVDATDDYYGLANIDDDQYAQFIKRVIDGVQITDSSIPLFSVGRSLFDNILSSDTSFYKNYSARLTNEIVRIKDFVGGETIIAGNFVPGKTYIIVNTGTTDYTLIGAPSNTPGTQFTATGTGSGTGTVSPVTEIVKVPVNADSIIPGKTYTITSTGTTDYTQIGAPNNTPGTVFIATGTGTGTGAVSQDVPSIVTNTTSGNFVPGQTYTIKNSGVTDYTQIGAGSSTTGTEFVATGTGTGSGTVIKTTGAGNFVIDKTYIIQNTGNTNYTTVGAVSNMPGTIFKATGIGSGTGNVVEVIKSTNIIPGKTYVIYNTGGDTDYTLIGAPNNTPGTQFTATGTGTGAGIVFETTPVSNIITGVTYIVQSIGTATDYTQIGAGSNTPGTTFTATGTGTGGGTAYQSTPTPVIENITTINNAGTFVPGKVYVITSTGTTDYTQIGAGSNTPGTTFIATGTGSGTGTASSTTPSLITTVTAGNLVPGQSYTITSTGTTDYTQIGASSNAIGTTFTATGSGSGTGSVYKTTPITSSITINSKYSTIDPITVTDSNTFYKSIRKVQPEILLLQNPIYKDIAKAFVDSLINTELLAQKLSVFKFDTVLIQAADIVLVKSDKLFSDNVYTANNELTTLRSQKVVPEVSVISESLQKAIAAILADIPKVTESTSKFLSTTLGLDQVTFTDYITVSRLISFINQITISEFNTLTPIKNSVELITTQDILSRIANFNLELLDFIDATDDYYGLANIDDDQYATVNKTLIDNSQVLDSLTAAYALPLAIDIFNVSDSSILTAKSAFIESIKISEQIISREISKILQDIVNKSDSLTNRLSKFFTDNVTILSSDLLVLFNSINFTPETTTVYDNNRFIVKPIFIEPIKIPEQLISHEISKILQDIVNKSDSLANKLNKFFTDNVTILSTDLLVLSNTINFTPETITINDNSKLTVKPIFIESNQVSEQIINREIGKILQDIVNKSETLNKTVGKTLIDSMTIFSTESIESYLNKEFGLVDTFQSLETFRQQFNKLSADSITTSDSIQNYGYGKGITDNIFSSETLITKGLSKYIRETLRVSDIIITSYTVAGPSKNITELLTVTSSVTINKQNYFASNYVSSGYAGTVTYST